MHTDAHVEAPSVFSGIRVERPNRAPAIIADINCPVWPERGGRPPPVARDDFPDIASSGHVQRHNRRTRVRVKDAVRAQGGRITKIRYPLHVGIKVLEGGGDVVVSVEGQSYRLLRGTDIAAPAEESVIRPRRDSSQFHDRIRGIDIEVWSPAHNPGPECGDIQCITDGERGFIAENTAKSIAKRDRVFARVRKPHRFDAQTFVGRSGNGLAVELPLNVKRSRDRGVEMKRGAPVQGCPLAARLFRDLRRTGDVPKAAVLRVLLRLWPRAVRQRAAPVDGIQKAAFKIHSAITADIEASYLVAFRV